MNADTMVNHCLWHQRTGAGREPVCPICGNIIVQFQLDDMLRAQWICYLGHKIITPVWSQDASCPFLEVHEGSDRVSV